MDRYIFYVLLAFYNVLLRVRPLVGANAVLYYICMCAALIVYAEKSPEQRQAMGRKFLLLSLWLRVDVLVKNLAA